MGFGFVLWGVFLISRLAVFGRRNALMLRVYCMSGSSFSKFRKMLVLLTKKAEQTKKKKKQNPPTDILFIGSLSWHR